MAHPWGERSVLFRWQDKTRKPTTQCAEHGWELTQGQVRGHREVDRPRSSEGRWGRQPAPQGETIRTDCTVEALPL